KNGGFSTADRDKLVRPVIDSGPYGYQHVNVAEQRRDPDSLLSWMQALIRVRKECPEIGRGNLRIIDVENPAVLAHRFDWSDGAVIMLHNFSDQPVDVLLDKVHEENEYTIDLFGENRFKHVSLDQPLQLEAYGYRWLRVAGSEWELP
ncbi:MAG: alpha-glucosidase C-terminal domain-containing protein, partial [Aureliella sp.]